MTIMQNNRYNLSETNTTSQRTLTALSHRREEMGGGGQRRQRETSSDNALEGNRWGRDIVMTAGINTNMENNSTAQGKTRLRFIKDSGKVEQAIEMTSRLESKSRSIYEERTKIKRSCFYAKSRFERITDDQTSKIKDNSYFGRETSYFNQTAIEPKSDKQTKTVRSRTEKNPSNKTCLWVKSPQSFIPIENKDKEWQRLLERRKRSKEGLKLTQLQKEDKPSPLATLTELNYENKRNSFQTKYPEMNTTHSQIHKVDNLETRKLLLFPQSQFFKEDSLESKNYVGMDLTLVNLDLSHGRHTLDNSSDDRLFSSGNLVNEKSKKSSVHQNKRIENDLERISIIQKEMDRRMEESPSEPNIKVKLTDQKSYDDKSIIELEHNRKIMTQSRENNLTEELESGNNVTKEYSNDINNLSEMKDYNEHTKNNNITVPISENFDENKLIITKNDSKLSFDKTYNINDDLNNKDIEYNNKSIEDDIKEFKTNFSNTRQNIKSDDMTNDKVIKDSNAMHKPVKENNVDNEESSENCMNDSDYSSAAGSRSDTKELLESLDNNHETDSADSNDNTNNAKANDTSSKDSACESESEYESEEDDSEKSSDSEKEGRSSDSGVGLGAQALLPKKKILTKRLQNAFGKSYFQEEYENPYSEKPLPPFSDKELELEAELREWVNALNNPSSTIIKELQSKYGALLAPCTKLPPDESKITSVIGEKDENGAYHGEIEINYENGDYFWGDMDHGSKEGMASVVLSNGDNFMGRFKDNQLDGFVQEVITYLDRDNVTREVFYSRGVRHGFYREIGPSKQFWCAGRFSNGEKIGTQWRWGRGGCYNVGNVDADNKPDGDDNIYLYPDLLTAMDGSYVRGKMKEGHLAMISGLSKDFGIPVPETVRLLSDKIYSYEPSSTNIITKRPMLRDPYEQRYVFVKESLVPFAGEGLFAKQKIKPGQLCAVFNGVRQRHLWGVKGESKAWSDYRISVDRDCDLDIRPEQESLKNYKATLAHKTCHSFTPNSYFNQYWHPRFGLVMAVLSHREILPGEEISVSYNYGIQKAPQWYQDLWFYHLRNELDWTEAKVYGWAERSYRKSGLSIDVPPPHKNSSRFIGCGHCEDHVGLDSNSVACQICTTWFHIDCTNIQLEEVLDKENQYTWTCPECK